MYIKINIILIENLRKWLNFILLIIKLIWFFFGEMYFKCCYCIFYLVYVVFIDFKVEKIFEFVLKIIFRCFWFNVCVISVKIS